jgi:hypothetical protein
MHTRARSPFALLLGLLLAAPPVHAGPPDAKARAAASSAKAKGNEAKRHLDAGTKLFRAKSYAAALRELEQAQKLAPRASTLKMMAECHFKLNEYAAAYDQYEQLAKGPGLSKADAEDVRRMLKTLDLLTGLVDISDSGTPVEIFIDGKAMGKTPFNAPLRVGAGQHKLRASINGADVMETDITVKPQETLPVPIDAVPKPLEGPAAAAAGKSGKSGKVSISVTPSEATILIDGEERGAGSFEGDLPVGTHKLVVIYVGYKNEEREITVTEGETTSESVKLASESEEKASADAKGIYGSAALFGALPIVGATTIPAEINGTAASSLQLAGGLSLHGGYSFGLFGIEGTFALLGDRHTEQHAVPGTTNPESPDFPNNSAYTEAFLIYSIGGFAGVGPRVTTPGQNIRFTAGASPGLSIRSFTLKRNIGVGVVDASAASASRTTFAIIGDASVLIGLSPSLKLMIGLFAWIDLGGPTVTPEGDNRVITVPSGDHTVDTNIPSPSYAVQRGTEIFVGPQIGVRFGH